MILHVSPHAPVLLRAAAVAILFVHIGGGTLGMASGAAALVLRKGSRLHALAGTVFFASMLITTVIGACIAPFLPDRISSFMGVFTFYLVVTAWLTVHRKPGTVGQFDYGMLVLVLGVIAAAVYLSWLDFQGATSEIDHEPYQAAIVFGSLALIAAAFDVKVILPGGISGAQRISRHLWLAKLAS